jgi:UDP:flavonoid glycosyltransferase YjiC (YdhE family)
MGTITAFLLAGVPLLLLPTQVEQWLMAQNVVRLGAGAIPNGAPTRDVMHAAICAMLATSSYKTGAKAYQQKHAAFANEQPGHHLVTEIDKLMTGAASA